MEEEELRKIVNVVYWLWHSGKVGQSTIEAAERIKNHQLAHRGDNNSTTPPIYHECEVSCGGEADLHKHYNLCKKNPYHSEFIPVQDFKIEHLPLGYQTNVLMDWIRTNADLTCRLLVQHTSMNRAKRCHNSSETYPFYKDRGGNFMRTGTGWVVNMDKYTEENNITCECDKCKSTCEPHKVWAKVDINTAMHVVYDDDEAGQTTCYFGYDTSTTRLDRCLKLTGLKVQHSWFPKDQCTLTYVTHDMDIINKLYKMYCARELLIKRRMEVFFSTECGFALISSHCDHNPKPGPVVIISHPHGCSKHISVGMWTNREWWGTMKLRRLDGPSRVSNAEDTRYIYNAHTCPGSSGAPVIRLPNKGDWQLTPEHHPHSSGSKYSNDLNTSVVSTEQYVTPREDFDT